MVSHSKNSTHGNLYTSVYKYRVVISSRLVASEGLKDIILKRSGQREFDATHSLFRSLKTRVSGFKNFIVLRTGKYKNGPKGPLRLWVVSNELEPTLYLYEPLENFWGGVSYVGLVSLVSETPTTRYKVINDFEIP